MQQNIDPAIFFHNLIHCGINGFGIRYIRENVLRIKASIGQSLDCSSAFTFDHIHHDNLCTSLGKAQRQYLAQAVGSGDNCDFIGELEKLADLGLFYDWLHNPIPFSMHRRRIHLGQKLSRNGFSM